MSLAEKKPKRKLKELNRKKEVKARIEYRESKKLIQDFKSR